MAISMFSDLEYGRFRQFVQDIAGINLSDAKKQMVCGRLAKRLQDSKLGSYGEYFRLLESGTRPDELQVAVDLLTTNETYFFREEKHFEFLAQQVLPASRAGQQFRVWSAACSSGEEPYSIAMVLAEHFGEGLWQVLASDLSTRVLEQARAGLYPMARAEKIPRQYLLEYCLKGVGGKSGTFMIDNFIRNHVRFEQINLNESLPKTGDFDMIFLRNVMIYFENETKRKVVSNLLHTLKRGGYFIVGHSESLNGVTSGLVMKSPSIYMKP